MNEKSGRFMNEHGEYSLRVYYPKRIRNAPAVIFMPGSFPYLVPLMYGRVGKALSEKGYVVALVTPPSSSEGALGKMYAYGAGFVGAGGWLRANTSCGKEMGWAGHSLGAMAIAFGIQEAKDGYVEHLLPKAFVSIAPGCPDPHDGEHDESDQVIYDSFRGVDIPAYFIGGSKDCVSGNGLETHYKHCVGEKARYVILGANHIGFLGKLGRNVSEFIRFLGLLGDCEATISHELQLEFTVSAMKDWFNHYLKEK